MAITIDASGIKWNDEVKVPLDILATVDSKATPEDLVALGVKNEDGVLVDSDGAPVKANTTNKCYVQTYTGGKTITDDDAQTVNTFPEVTIQKGKDVELYLYVPTRCDDNDNWGGMYLNINVKVAGTWYNLGNPGYDGGVMGSGAKQIHNFTNTRVLKLCGELGLTDEYTFQVELTARSYNADTKINDSHDINRTANNLNARGDVVSWGGNQNYTTIHIKEIDAD